MPWTTTGTCLILQKHELKIMGKYFSLLLSVESVRIWQYGNEKEKLVSTSSKGFLICTIEIILLTRQILILFKKIRSTKWETRRTERIRIKNKQTRKKKKSSMDINYSFDLKSFIYSSIFSFSKRVLYKNLKKY